MRAIQGRRRALALLVTCLLAAGSAAGLASGLVSCSAAEPPKETTRPLNAVEAGRLATMRLHNFQDGRVGFRGAFGQPGVQIAVSGWVDWQLPLAYLSVTGPQPGPNDGLVQATPGVVAYRPGRIVAQPPAEPPADGWRVRRFATTGPKGSPLDTMLALLFTIAVNQTDTADLLARSEARWLGSDQVDGVPVDVLLGPAVPPRATPPASTSPFAPPEPSAPEPSTPVPSASADAAPSPGSFAAQGGAVRYWLDSDARLHRLEAVVGADLPLRLDFARAERRELIPVAELGGRPIAPRRPTEAEADVLARLRQRNRAVSGGTVTVTLPRADEAPLTAAGWLDWRNAIAYLAVRDTASTLVRADRTGMSVLAGTTAASDGRPPVPAPRGAWQRTTWPQRAAAPGPASDLDLLLNEIVGLSSSTLDNAEYLRASAIWLRADTLDGAPVMVVEIPKPAERGLPAGAARLRYWIDGSGVLRRLEVRSRTGGYGRLDLTLGGQVPYVAVPRRG